LKEAGASISCCENGKRTYRFRFESKDVVDSAPSNVKEGVTKDEAEGLKKSLEDAGAVVELK
jgi:hypothetical protein